MFAPALHVWDLWVFLLISVFVWFAICVLLGLVAQTGWLTTQYTCEISLILIGSFGRVLLWWWQEERPKMDTLSNMSVTCVYLFVCQCSQFGSPPFKVLFLSGLIGWLLREATHLIHLLWRQHGNAARGIRTAKSGGTLAFGSTYSCLAAYHVLLILIIYCRWY